MQIKYIINNLADLREEFARRAAREAGARSVQRAVSYAWEAAAEIVQNTEFRTAQTEHLRMSKDALLYRLRLIRAQDQGAGGNATEAEAWRSAAVLLDNLIADLSKTD